VLEGRDGRVSIAFTDGIPVPLEEADHQKLDETGLGYDMVGRGIYLALRNNPDCVNSAIYAGWLRDAYPHYLAELASHILMLDNKDVEVSYLDRKINYLKVMALLQPDDPGILGQIGATFLDRGTRMSALHQSTVNLYRAETFLKRAVELNSSDATVKLHLGEVLYLLGRYQQASENWRDILPGLKGADAERLVARCAKVEGGAIPRVPPVDYLEAIGVAFGCYQGGDFEECAAILRDVLDDLAFCEEFPLPEVWYYLGLCFQNLAMPRDAEKCLREALQRDPGFTDAQQALTDLAR